MSNFIDIDYVGNALREAKSKIEKDIEIIDVTKNELEKMLIDKLSCLNILLDQRLLLEIEKVRIDVLILNNKKENNVK